MHFPLMYQKGAILVNRDIIKVGVERVPLEFLLKWLELYKQCDPEDD